MFVSETYKCSGQTIIILVRIAREEFESCRVQFMQESRFIEIFVVSVEHYLKSKSCSMCFKKCHNHFMIITYPCFDSKSFLEVKRFVFRKQINLRFTALHKARLSLPLLVLISCSLMLD